MPSLFIASAKLDSIQVIAILAAGILGVPVFIIVHYGLEYCYLVYARRFCRKNGFKMVNWRSGPAFDESGFKTEFTIFELDCLDGQSQRKLIRLLIWIFGIRKMLSNENYPESHHEVSPAS